MCFWSILGHQVGLNTDFQTLRELFKTDKSSEAWLFTDTLEVDGAQTNKGMLNDIFGMALHVYGMYHYLTGWIVSSV